MLTTMNLAKSIRSDFDAATLLPPAAAAKLEALRRDRDAGADRVHGLAQRSEMAQSDLRDAHLQLQLVEHQDRHGSARAPERIAAAREKVDRLRQRFEAIQAERHTVVARMSALRDQVAGLEKYALYVKEAGCVIAPYTGPIGPAGSERAAVALERVRAEIARLEQEVIAADHAPRPRAEVRAEIVAQINAAAVAGAPNLSGVIERRGAGKIEWPTIGFGRRDGRAPDALAVLTWLARDALIDRLDELLAQRHDEARALDDTARTTRLAELRAELLEAGRVEEALIEAAARDGVDIPRRVDADPRAVLGLADDLPAPKGRR